LCKHAEHGYALAEVVGHTPFTVKAHVKYWASPCEIFGVGTGLYSGHSALYEV